MSLWKKTFCLLFMYTDTFFDINVCWIFNEVLSVKSAGRIVMQSKYIFLLLKILSPIFCIIDIHFAYGPYYKSNGWIEWTQSFSTNKLQLWEHNHSSILITFRHKFKNRPTYCIYYFCTEMLNSLNIHQLSKYKDNSQLTCWVKRP